MPKKNKVEQYIASLSDVKGKTVIITGANSGLGYQIAKVALLKGATVVLACRSVLRATEATNKLIEETGSYNIHTELYDQISLNSVRFFVRTIKKKYPDFYALILNAGVLYPPERIDDKGYSTLYLTNFLGAFVLLEELKEFLEQSQIERRIVIQGSLASFRHKYKNSHAFILGKMPNHKTYSLSKLCCSNLYVYHKNHNHNRFVKYLLCEPGVAVTNLFNSLPKWFKKFAFPLMKIIFNTSEEGALSACKLMCDAAANGDYYRPAHFFSCKGLPKKSVYPKKYIFDEIIVEAQQISSGIYE